MDQNIDCITKYQFLIYLKSIHLLFIYICLSLAMPSLPKDIDIVLFIYILES